MKNVVEELKDGTPYVSLLNYFSLPYETRQFLNRAPGWRFDFDRMAFLKAGDDAEVQGGKPEPVVSDPTFDAVPTMEVAFGR